MNDTDRILEAISILRQQIANLECEFAGLRTDVQQIAATNDLAKKKWPELNGSYMTPWSNWRLSAPGAAPRRKLSGW